MTQPLDKGIHVNRVLLGEGLSNKIDISNVRISAVVITIPESKMIDDDNHRQPQEVFS